jgi:proteasome lid subunit RPN8/RPN11
MNLVEFENERKTNMAESSIFLDQKLLDRMLAHASLTYPEECCGLMIGEFRQGTAMKKVTFSRAVVNVFEKSERYHRYTIDPREYVSIENEAEKSGKEVVGIYHSHPNASPRPSQYDHNDAWPTLSYVVIEVRERKPIDVASWRLKDDKSSFLEEQLTVEKIPLEIRARA